MAGLDDWYSQVDSLLGTQEQDVMATKPEEPVVVQETPKSGLDNWYSQVDNLMSSPEAVKSEPQVSSMEPVVSQDKDGGILDDTAKFFSGSGIPTAAAGLTYAYYAGTQGLYDTLGYEEGAKLAEQNKNFWKAKTDEYKVKEYEGNIIDNPMLALNPMYWNYQVGKMVPAAAATPVGGLTGTLLGGSLLSAEGSARTYEEVLKETGSKFAASGAAATSFATNTVLEAAGLGAILKPIGTIGTRAFKGFMSEGGTEFSQTLVDEVQQIFWEKAAQGYSVPDIAEYIKPKLPGILKDAAGSFITGGVIGGGISSVSGQAPESKQEAEQVLADLNVIPQEEVGMDPEVTRVIQELNNMPPVELAPVGSQVPSVENVIDTGNVEVRQNEEEVGEAQQLVDSWDSPYVAPEAQLALETQEAPVVPEAPIVPEEVPAVDEQVTQAQEAMYGQGREVGLPMDQPLSPFQLEQVYQIEPPEYRVLETQLFAKGMQSAPLSAVVKTLQNTDIIDGVRTRVEAITGKPVKSLVTGATQVGEVTFRNIVKDTIEDRRKELLGLKEERVVEEEGVGSQEQGGEIVPGEEVSSKGIVTTPKDTIVSPTDSQVSLEPSSISSSNTILSHAPDISIYPTNQIYSGNVAESLDVLEEAPRDTPFTTPISQQEIRQVIAEEAPIVSQQLNMLPKIKDVKQAVAITNKLGITDKVIEKLNKIVGKTQRSPTATFAMAKKDNVLKAISEVMQEERESKVRQKRLDQESIEPSAEVLKQQEQLTTPPTVKAEKAPVSPETVNRKAEESMAETKKEVEAERDKTTKEIYQEGLKAIGKNISEWSSRYLSTAIDTLYYIDKKFGGIMERFEARVLNKVKQRQDNIKPFKDWWKKASALDRAMVHKALQNYHKQDQRAILDRITDPNFKNAFKQVQAVLEEVQNEYVAYGLLGKARKHYFPNRVKDIDGLLEYIDTKIKDQGGVIKHLRELTGNNKLSIEEAKVLFQRLLEKGQHPAMFMSPSSVKGKTIWDINKEMQKFYYDPMETLDAHIREATEAIEQRRVIGSSKVGILMRRMENLNKKLIKTEKELEELKSITEALSKTETVSEGELSEFITKTVQDGSISPQDQRLVLEVFRARFNQKPMGRVLSALKDISLASALGQIGSTITQMSDIAPLLVKDIPGTIKAMLSSKQYTKADVDTHAFIKDLSTSKTTAEVLEKILKGSGFEAMDGFFASAGMELAMQTGKKMSAQEFQSQFEHIFGEDTQQLKADLDAGKKTDLTLQYAVIELSKTRPLFPSNMPVGHLRGGNWRILYALKSWSLKTANNLVRDVRKAKREKGLGAAAIMALKHITFLAMAGAGADAIKDLILGRDVDFPEKVLDNILKLFFMNKFAMRGYTQGQFADTIMGNFTPPLGFIEKPFQDLVVPLFDEKAKNEWKSVQEIPVFGRVLWYQFSQGGEKSNLNKERKAAFATLEKAIKHNDPEYMKEYRKKQKEYNEKVREYNKANPPDKSKDEKPLKPLDSNTVSRMRDRIRKKQKAEE